MLEGAFKVIKSSCYGEASTENPAKFDTNHETANTKCIEIYNDDFAIGSPIQVGTCKEEEFENAQCPTQGWEYIDLWRKCPACGRKPVPEFMGLANNTLPEGATDCMGAAFKGGCYAVLAGEPPSMHGFDKCGKSCCCDSRPWTCAEDSFTCGCWHSKVKCWG